MREVRINLGRPPKPTAKHKRDGTYRTTRHGGRNEPQFGKAAMTPPTELNAAAKKEWKRLARELAALGLFTRADRAVFAVYCQAWADWVALTKKINSLKSGITFTTANGYIGVHPIVGARSKAWAMMKEAATRFGLDPSSRTRLDVLPMKDGESDEDFFYGAPKLEK